MRLTKIWGFFLVERKVKVMIVVMIQMRLSRVRLKTRGLGHSTISHGVNSSSLRIEVDIKMKQQW